MRVIFSMALALALLSSCGKESDENVLPEEIPVVRLQDSIDFSKEFDAPFAYLDGDSIRLKRLLHNEVGDAVITRTFSAPRNENFEFTVFVNHINAGYKDFKVNIDPKISFQNSDDWTTDEEILVTSDYEGEFFDLVDFLHGVGAMDEDYTWTFGKKHLVLVGDIFDRGEMVHECLWLLYKLRSEGANIHMVYGNHDIMNLSGNQVSDIAKKYFTTVNALGFEKIEELYQPNTVHGSWLRQLNLIERGNAMLFMHGGLSRKLLDKFPDMTIANTNAIVRRNLDTPKSPESIEFLSGKTSITWFRNYFNMPRERMEDLDYVLQHFDAKRICVGHTIQREVGLSYDGKVVGVDVNVHKGQKEGVLFSGDEVYRLIVQEKGKPAERLKL